MATTQGLVDSGAWAAFFSAYETIVLVANSEGADVGALRREHGKGTLFVFFNKVYKVLSEPFAGEAILVARSSPAGANIVYRREVDDVLRLLAGPGFRGILNLKAGESERFSPAGDFDGAAVGHLDLCSRMDGFYPASHVPTSGFALALFLVEAVPDARVVLAGFTAKRSTNWKLFHDHDWTFEQIVQRLLFRNGRLRTGQIPESGSLQALERRFPEISAAEIATVASEVLAERLETANVAIDDLLKLTRPLGRIDGLVRRLKPPTRKQRLARREDGGA